ncbi:MAG TPA: GGDEF domain-containing protein, partial [Gammaproteobacteria bacterium]|nr:GGDEF domain-containing protein [Gammaproteobacteria bacterium]
MDSNPYTEELAQASEYLRLALALLAKHRIPPSPLNYRIGYDYAAGRNAKLQEAFDSLVARNKAANPDALWGLYQQNFIQDEEALDNMRRELRRIISDVQGEFEQSGNHLSRYVSTLDRFAGLLEEPEPRENMASEVNRVIGETRSMEQSQNQLGEQLSGIVAEVQALRRELEQVREESLTDALTGISNRKAFDAALEDAT